MNPVILTVSSNLHRFQLHKCFWNSSIYVW